MQPEQAAAPPLPAELEPLRLLVGTWRGTGRGRYPTIEPFDFEAEVHVGHLGGSWLIYALRSWRLPSRAPSHSEAGYWRPGSEGRVEAVLAHGLGVAEVSEGAIEGDLLRLASTSCGRSRTGSRVTRVQRAYRIAEHAMRYEIRMATEETELAVHLEGELHRER
jgi:THAP4-like, heme-binding beta-barrel domain